MTLEKQEQAKLLHQATREFHQELLRLPVGTVPDNTRLVDLFEQMKEEVVRFLE